MAIQVNIWSDVLCPWCFVGKRRFEKALSTFGEAVDITWHSFELDPGRSAERQLDLNSTQRLAKKYGLSVERAVSMVQQMTDTGKAEGIDFHLENSQTRQSFDAHRLIHFAKTQNKHQEMKERLFLAHFCEELDCGNAEILVKLAAEIGLDAEQANAVLQSEDFAKEVRTDEQAAAQFQITGVPFFIIGKYGVSGAQSPEVLLQTLKRAQQDAQDLQEKSGAPNVSGSQKSKNIHAATLAATPAAKVNQVLSAEQSSQAESNQAEPTQVAENCSDDSCSS